MNLIERYINRLTDTNWMWWPFLKFRPAQTEKYPLGLASLFGLYFWIVASVIAIGGTLAIGKVVPIGVGALAVLFVLVLTVINQASVVWAWNRRAKKLAENAANNSLQARRP